MLMMNSNMWLHKLVFIYLRWSLSIYKKFFKLVPKNTLVIVVATLVSQFSNLLAFFLPLKVIIIIGSESIPRYFPQPLLGVNKEHLILFLSLLAVLFYLTTLISEKIIEYNSELGASKVLKSSEKVTLFGNQEALAKNTYHRFVRSLSALVFVFLVIVVFFLFYPFFALALLGYLTLLSIFVSFAAKKITKFRVGLLGNASSLIGLLSGVSFVFLFSFIVLDLVVWKSVSASIAMLSLLLLRQFLQRLSSVFKDAIFLTSKKIQINSMFFRGHVFISQTEDSHGSNFLGLLKRENLLAALQPVLVKVLDVSPHAVGIVSTQWKQTGFIDVFSFKVTVTVKDDKVKRMDLLVKVFSHKQKKMASSEADILLLENKSKFPALKLLGVSKLQECPVHIFELPSGECVENDELKSYIPQVMMHLWQTLPSKNLIERYCRSHPLLMQRVSLNMVDRLMLIASELEQKDVLNSFRNNFEKIKGLIEELPLCIINHALNSNCIYNLEQGGLIVTHWGRWGLEPIGAAFPTGDEAMRHIADMFESALSHNELLKNVKVQHVQLCAYMFQFERLFNVQKYEEALKLLPLIISCLEINVASDSIASERVLNLN